MGVLGLTMDSGKPEGGMNFKIDELSHRFLIGKPFSESNQWDMMHDDILARNPAARVFPDQILRLKKVGAFRCQTG